VSRSWSIACLVCSKDWRCHASWLLPNNYFWDLYVHYTANESSTWNYRRRNLHAGAKLFWPFQYPWLNRITFSVINMEHEKCKIGERGWEFKIRTFCAFQACKPVCSHHHHKIGYWQHYIEKVSDVER
jgi:hypothetical protein